jgi:hypothetical protein
MTPSQKFENLNETKHFNIPGDSTPHSHRCKNFKSQVKEDKTVRHKTQRSLKMLHAYV